MKNLIIEVLLISLKARRNSARNYRYNDVLQLEVNLLDAQIKALREALDEEKV